MAVLTGPSFDTTGDCDKWDLVAERGIRQCAETNHYWNHETWYSLHARAERSRRRIIALRQSGMLREVM